MTREVFGTKTVVPNYSTVTEYIRCDVDDPKNKKDFFLKISCTLSVENCNLNITNYTRYQQKLYRLIKFLKENRGIGYKRISHIMTEKGYRSVRTKSILKPNFIFSIYKKGKLREDRLKRKYTDPYYAQIALRYPD